MSQTRQPKRSRTGVASIFNVEPVPVSLYPNGDAAAGSSKVCGNRQRRSPIASPTSAGNTSGLSIGNGGLIDGRFARRVGTRELQSAFSRTHGGNFCSPQGSLKFLLNSLYLYAIILLVCLCKFSKQVVTLDVPRKSTHTRNINRINNQSACFIHAYLARWECLVDLDSGHTSIQSVTAD